MDTNRDNSSIQVHPDSIEIGDFRIEEGFLTASLRVIVCGRPENLILCVAPLGDEIAVAVWEAVLDYSSLAVVAQHAAAKLNTPAGRAVLKLASENRPQNLPRGPHVRVRINRPGDTSNG